MTTQTKLIVNNDSLPTESCIRAIISVIKISPIRDLRRRELCDIILPCYVVYVAYTLRQLLLLLCLVGSLKTGTAQHSGEVREKTALQYELNSLKNSSKLYVKYRSLTQREHILCKLQCTAAL